MQLITLFLLTGCLSIATAGNLDREIIKTEPNYQLIQMNAWFDFPNQRELKNKIRKSMHEGNPIKLGSTGYKLTHFQKGLYLSGGIPIWKGKINDEDNNEKKVAIMALFDQKDMMDRIAEYEALGAIGKPEVEESGIPQIYYSGELFNAYVIVLTLYDNSLYGHWFDCKKKFNEYTTLEVFLQLVKILRYLETKKVVHNGISPDCIFIRGKKVYLDDFEGATINGRKRSGLRNDHPKTAMDDLKSVIDSIWAIQNISSQFPKFDGLWNKDQQDEVVEENCEYFKDFAAAKRACLFICKDEALSNKVVPDYVKIFQYLEEALHDVKTNSNQKWIG